MNARMSVFHLLYSHAFSLSLSAAENFLHFVFFVLSVSAKQVYMADIVKQASSTQYWDMWSRQKLSPEVEQKQQNIRKAHQVYLKS